VAAAVANAVARGLGVRIGDLPITRDRIISALA
jgi:CO/xanthine dehydrogenase Mo-binding subunit